MSQQQEMTGTVGQQLGEANRFEIAGPIVITFDRTSTAAVPLLSYQDAQVDLQFSGNDIVQAGELVTVVLENAVDAFVRTFTLVVPKIRLALGDEVAFDTFGVETVDRSGAFVPPPGAVGVLQTFRVHQLAGVATLVNF
jgi:hypothetical protein